MITVSFFTPSDCCWLASSSIRYPSNSAVYLGAAGTQRCGLVARRVFIYAARQREIWCCLYLIVQANAIPELVLWSVPQLIYGLD